MSDDAGKDIDTSKKEAQSAANSAPAAWGQQQWNYDPAVAQAQWAQQQAAWAAAQQGAQSGQDAQANGTNPWAGYDPSQQWTAAWGGYDPASWAAWQQQYAATYYYGMQPYPQQQQQQQQQTTEQADSMPPFEPTAEEKEKGKNSSTPTSTGKKSLVKVVSSTIASVKPDGGQQEARSKGPTFVPAANQSQGIAFVKSSSSLSVDSGSQSSSASDMQDGLPQDVGQMKASYESSAASLLSDIEKLAEELSKSEANPTWDVLFKTTQPKLFVAFWHLEHLLLKLPPDFSPKANHSIAHLKARASDVRQQRITMSLQMVFNSSKEASVQKGRKELTMELSLKFRWQRLAHQWNVCSARAQRCLDQTLGALRPKDLEAMRKSQLRARLYITEMENVSDTKRPSSLFSLAQVALKECKELSQLLEVHHHPVSKTAKQTLSKMDDQFKSLPAKFLTAVSEAHAVQACSKHISRVLAAVSLHQDRCSELTAWVQSQRQAYSAFELGIGDGSATFSLQTGLRADVKRKVHDRQKTAKQEWEDIVKWTKQQQKKFDKKLDKCMLSITEALDLPNWSNAVQEQLGESVGVAALGMTDSESKHVKNLKEKFGQERVAIKATLTALKEKVVETEAQWATWIGQDIPNAAECSRQVEQALKSREALLAKEQADAEMIEVGSSVLDRLADQGSELRISAGTPSQQRLDNLNQARGRVTFESAQCIPELKKFKEQADALECLPRKDAQPLEALAAAVHKNLNLYRLALDEVREQVQSMLGIKPRAVSSSSAMPSSAAIPEPAPAYVPPPVSSSKLTIIPKLTGEDAPKSSLSFEGWLAGRGAASAVAAQHMTVASRGAYQPAAVVTSAARAAALAAAASIGGASGFSGQISGQKRAKEEPGQVKDSSDESSEGSSDSRTKHKRKKRRTRSSSAEDRSESRSRKHKRSSKHKRKSGTHDQHESDEDASEHSRSSREKDKEHRKKSKKSKKKKKHKKDKDTETDDQEGKQEEFEGLGSAAHRSRDVDTAIKTESLLSPAAKAVAAARAASAKVAAAAEKKQLEEGERRKEDEKRKEDEAVRQRELERLERERLEQARLMAEERNRAAHALLKEKQEAKQKAAEDEEKQARDAALAATKKQREVTATKFSITASPSEAEETATVTQEKVEGNSSDATDLSWQEREKLEKEKKKRLRAQKKASKKAQKEQEAETDEQRIAREQAEIERLQEAKRRAEEEEKERLEKARKKEEERLKAKAAREEAIKEKMRQEKERAEKEVAEKAAIARNEIMERMKKQKEQMKQMKKAREVAEAVHQEEASAAAKKRETFKKEKEQREIERLKVQQEIAEKLAREKKEREETALAMQKLEAKILKRKKKEAKKEKRKRKSKTKKNKRSKRDSRSNSRSEDDEDDDEGEADQEIAQDGEEGSEEAVTNSNTNLEERAPTDDAVEGEPWAEGGGLGEETLWVKGAAEGGDGDESLGVMSLSDFLKM
eukprot:g23429.t1